MAMIAIGKVVVTTAGTRVRATVNQTDPTARVAAQSITFQALPGNTGKIFVGDAAVVGSTLAHTYLELPAPVSSLTGPFTEMTVKEILAPAGLNIADFYIDSDVNGEGVLISATVQ